MLFLIIFIIIVIVFTVGYAALPIITIKDTSIDASQSTAVTFNISDIKYVLSNTNDLSQTYTQNTNYTDINYTMSLAYKTLLYTCIAITCLISSGIIISFFKITFVSKILFGFALTFMLLLCSSIIFVLNTNIITSIIPTQLLNLSNYQVNYETGFILMSVASVIMLVNNLLYSFLG